MENPDKPTSLQDVVSECLNGYVPDPSNDIDNLKLKLNIAQKMLKNKEDTLNILEESLKYSKNQVTELKKACINLQNDRDSKEAEVLNLQRAINFHINTISELQRERIEHSSVNDDVFYQKMDNESYLCEIEKYKYDIDSLKYDLGIMENLYKSNNEELIKQQKTIDALRQAYLDHRLDEINLMTDNNMLLLKLKSKNTIQYQCNVSSSSLKNVECDLFAFKLELKALKLILENDDLTAVQRENVELKKENMNLRLKITSLKKCSKSFQIKCKKAHNKFKKSQNNLSNMKFKLNLAKVIIKEKTNCATALQKKIISDDTILQSMRNDISKLTARQDELINDAENYQQKIADLEEQLSISQENNAQLQTSLSNAEESLRILHEKYNDKDESIAWLEYQLSESSTRGSDLCNKSQEVFEFVKRLLKQTKDERKFLQKKIRVLQNVNKILSSNQDNSTFGKNCDFYIDN